MNTTFFTISLNSKELFKWPMVITIFLFSLVQLSAQLDSIHYLPPMKQAVTSAANVTSLGHRIYLSTNVTTAFDVNVYYGNSVVPDTVLTNLSNGTPLELNLHTGIDANTDGIDDGAVDGIIQLEDAQTGVVQMGSGMRFESTTGDVFYVNYRVRSSNQSDLFTCKGSKALSTEFRWGGIPNASTNIAISTSLGIYATRNSTTVTITGYHSDCTFRAGALPSGITNDTITIDLEAGESYVLETITTENPANLSGWIGASITSNEPIALSNGQLVMSTGSGADAGMDQPVGIEVLGREYVLVRGAASNNNIEFGVVVATQDGTEVYAGDPTVPANLITVLNDGDFVKVLGNKYSGTGAGSNMLITTSRNAYIYQNTSGRNLHATVGMNFIPPTNCLLPNSVNNISNIRSIAGENSNFSSVTIVANASVTNLTITDDNGSYTPTASSIAGTTNYVTYYKSGLNGNVSVIADGPIAVGVFGRLGNIAGFAGYFSGFDTVPDVKIETAGIGCFESTGSITLEAPLGFIDYEWFLDGISESSGSSNTFIATEVGEYFVRAQKGAGCFFDSSPVDFFRCIEAIDDTFAGFYQAEETTTISVIDNDTFMQVQPIIGTAVGEISIKEIGTQSNLTLNADGTVTVKSGTTAGTYYLDYEICESNPDFTTNCSTARLSISVTAVLPVELISFNATVKDCQSKLKWESATELNFDFYQIERGLDGEQYLALDKINGEGNDAEGAIYEYNDETLDHRGNVYYRLKMVDFDETFEYSNIEVVSYEDCNDGKNQEIRIYPNPVFLNSNLTIDLPFLNDSYESKQLQIKVTDVLGRTAKIIASSNLNNGQATFSTEGLGFGTYFIQVLDEKGHNLGSDKVIIRE